MRSFKAEEFGEAHLQGRALKQKIGQVGLFGEWLERHKFGKFVRWQPGAFVTVAVEQNGAPKIPSAAALNQYILVQVSCRGWCGGCVLMIACARARARVSWGGGCVFTYVLPALARVCGRRWAIRFQGPRAAP